MKHITVVANKRWEADALVGVLASREARPSYLRSPQLVNQPPDTTDNLYAPIDSPRALIMVSDSDGNQSCEVSVWCIEDMMLPDSHKSSTEKKWPILKNQIMSVTRDLVVAFGTAAHPDHRSHNGCVVLGNNIFIYNPYPNGENKDSKWNHAKTEQLVRSGASDKFFDKITPQLRVEIEKRFINPPNNPATDLLVLHSQELLSVGVVNITDYSDYAWADHRTIERARAANITAPIGSMETTHGIIRLASDSPFLFISGIADRVGFFDVEVNPRTYAQNFTAAHNAGVALAWLIPVLTDALQK